MSGQVISLEDWLREKRAREERHWKAIIKEALRDLVVFGAVYVTDIRLAEDVWQATWEWNELYVLHGSGDIWVVERAIGNELVGVE